MNITDPIRRQARLAPDAVAIIHPAASLTIRALDQAIDRIAHHLHAQGLRPGQRAALDLNDTDDLNGLILALAMARLGVGIARHSLPDEFLSWRIAQPALGLPGTLTIPPALFTDTTTTDPLPSHPDPNAVFMVFHTSGSTGTPKHAPISHAAMRNWVTQRILCMPETTGPLLPLLPVGSIWAMNCALRQLWTGGTLVLSRDPATDIDRHQVVNLVAPINTMRDLVRHRGSAGPFASLRTAETSGSHLPPALHRQMADHLCPTVWNILAGTECGTIAAAPASLTADTPGCIGYLFPGVQAQAVDDTDQPLPPGTEGTLRYRSDMAATHYLGDPTASARAFRDGWFYPGDIGSVLPDGRLILRGRSDERINSGGVKVDARVIEAALCALPGVAEALAFALPDDTGLDMIWAAIVTQVRIDEVILNAHCAQHLGPRAPEVVIQLNDPPRTQYGKLDRPRIIAYAQALNAEMNTTAVNQAEASA